MKARKYIFGIALIGLIGSSCTDTWDEHYAQDTSKVNNTEISVVNATITDYLAQEPSLICTNCLTKQVWWSNYWRKNRCTLF